METDKEPERRRFERINKSFTVSYCVQGEERSDISSVKNISEGGVLFTTDREFTPQTVLLLKIYSPLDLIWLEAKGEVIESKEIRKNLIYETRVSFAEISNKTRKAILEIVNLFIKQKTSYKEKRSGDV